MGKWAARLVEKNAVPPQDGTDKTARTPLLSVMAVTPEGGGREFPSAPDDASAAFEARRARLVRWGWTDDEARALAARLAQRDLDYSDDRVSCADCRHYSAGNCKNHQAAGIGGKGVGRDLASLLQRCPGFGALPSADDGAHNHFNHSNGGN